MRKTGADHHRTKLNANDRIAIKELRFPMCCKGEWEKCKHSMPLQALANKFDVYPGTIKSVLIREKKNANPI